MDLSAISVRRARPHEGTRLTDLAVRAKSHWGYSEEFLESARADLTIDADTIRSARIYVVERRSATIGFYGLLGNPPRGRLEWMFLEPEAIGRGYGRWMWNDAVQRARTAGSPTGARIPVDELDFLSTGWPEGGPSALL
jgi:GNAT superfamily N-acetyltransferase